MLSLWLSIVPELRKVDILGDPKILFIADFLQSFSLETASGVKLFGSCEEMLSLCDQKGDSVLLSRRFCTDNVSCDNLVKIYPFLSFVCPSARETRDGISPTSGLTRLKENTSDYLSHFLFAVCWREKSKQGFSLFMAVSSPCC